MSSNNSDTEENTTTTTIAGRKWNSNLKLNSLTSSGGCISLSGSNGKERKSAFYRPQTTVLTNLQRGNTETHFCNEISLTFHERAGQGELTVEQIAKANSPDLIDKNGFTPLHWACYYGQLSSVQLLLQTGRVDVNKLAPDMVTPLLLAAAGGHHEIVRLLLQNSADSGHMDIVGNTALMYAAAGNHPHTCNELLLKNPDITVENENGDTAYSLAVENNSTLSQGILEHYLTALLVL